MKLTHLSEAYKPKKWIQGMNLKKGALTRSAKRAKMGVHAFAEKHKHDSGKLGKRSRLALVFASFHKK